jgi:hypothetical protein
MATTILNFPFELNTSLQVGDVLYYLATETINKRIGPCISVSGTSVTCEVDGDISDLTIDSYIFMAKDNEINTSGLTGYYAEVTFLNESTEYAELFAVNSEIFISSN